MNAICPGYINTEMVQAVPKDVLEKNDPAADPDRPAGRAGGDRALRGVPGLRRGRLDYRLDADRQWRAVFYLGVIDSPKTNASGSSPNARRNLRIMVASELLLTGSRTHEGVLDRNSGHLPVHAVDRPIGVRTGRRPAMQRHLRQGRVSMRFAEWWANYSSSGRRQAARMEIAPAGSAAIDPDARRRTSRISLLLQAGRLEDTSKPRPRGLSGVHASQWAQVTR